MTPEKELARFRHRLGETVAWCSIRHPSDPLRSLLSATMAPNPYAADRWSLVDGLCQKRSVLLEKERSFFNRKIPPARDLAGGRLLAYLQDTNLCDGAAEAASEGFFDVDNVPPWDTWVWPAPQAGCL